MTLAELNKLLRATGYPVAYSHFKTTQTVPFITYLVAYNSNFHADNKVHTKIKNAQIELYTNYKDEKAEERLEDLFDEHDIPWDSTETFIESEQLFQKLYEFGVI